MKVGDIILLPMPEATLSPGKVRPVLLLAVLPGRHSDWLFCGISSRLAEAVPGWDELLVPNDPEFRRSGLRVASVIRLNWLATVSPAVVDAAGYLGSVAPDRLGRLLRRLAEHLARL